VTLFQPFLPDSNHTQNEKPRPAISKFMSTYGQKIWYIVLPLFALFVIAAVLLRKKKSGL